MPGHCLGNHLYRLLRVFFCIKAVPMTDKRIEPKPRGGAEVPEWKEEQKEIPSKLMPRSMT